MRAILPSFSVTQLEFVSFEKKFWFPFQAIPATATRLCSTDISVSLSVGDDNLFKQQNGQIRRQPHINAFYVPQ